MAAESLETEGSDDWDGALAVALQHNMEEYVAE